MMHKKVMVIDDMYLDRFVASHVITRFRFSKDVILIESASEGLTYLRSNKDNVSELPAIIFLDIQMPDMNGFDFLDEFNRMPQTITESCKVVMLTSSVDAKDLKKASEYKLVRHYITKPMDEKKLNELTLILE